jgi:hypothetical protein
VLDRTVDQNDSAVITKECFESFQQSPSYSYIIFLATYFMFFFKFEMSLQANQTDHNTTTIPSVLAYQA